MNAGGGGADGVERVRLADLTAGRDDGHQRWLEAEDRRPPEPIRRESKRADIADRDEGPASNAATDAAQHAGHQAARTRPRRRRRWRCRQPLEEQREREEHDGLGCQVADGDDRIGRRIAGDETDRGDLEQPDADA